MHRGASANRSQHLTGHLVPDAHSTTLVVETRNEAVTSVDAAKLPDDTRRAVMAEVETIQPQLKKPSPNAVIVREAGKSIRTILEGTASDLLATALWALMTATGAH